MVYLNLSNQGLNSFDIISSSEEAEVLSDTGIEIPSFNSVTDHYQNIMGVPKKIYINNLKTMPFWLKAFLPDNSTFFDLQHSKLVYLNVGEDCNVCIILLAQSEPFPCSEYFPAGAGFLDNRLQHFSSGARL